MIFPQGELNQLEFILPLSWACFFGADARMGLGLGMKTLTGLPF
jgi:hypothetical protein